MANKRISELPDAGAITGAELVEIVQSGTNVKSTVSAIGAGGAGTVTSFSSGNLTGLFTTNVATATTTPALSFGFENQNANTVLAGPTTAPAAAPEFRALVASDIPSLAGTYYQKTGNAFAGASVLGLTDNFTLTLQTGIASILINTNATTRLTITSTGKTTWIGSDTGANATGFEFNPSVTATANSQIINGVKIIATVSDGGFSSVTRRIFHAVDNAGTSGFAVNIGSAAWSGGTFTLTHSSGSDGVILSLNKSSEVFRVVQEGGVVQTPGLSSTNSTVNFYVLQGSKTGANATETHTAWNTTSTFTSGSSNNTHKAYSISPTFTCGAFNPTLVGIDYNPTITGTPGSHHGIKIQTATAVNVFGAATGNVTVDINGGLALRHTSPAQITADQNDYAIGTGTAFRLNTDASRNITGLTGGVNGKVLIILNVGAFNIVFTNEDAASTAANRITSSTGGSLTILPNGCVVFQYDSTSSRWRDISVR